MRIRRILGAAALMLAVVSVSGMLGGCALTESVEPVVKEVTSRIFPSVDVSGNNEGYESAGDLGEPVEPAESLTGFAYDQLDESIQLIYAQLYTGIASRKTEFTIRAADTEDIKPALSAIMTDCPQFFWIDGNANMSGFRTLGIWRIKLNFIVEPDEIDYVQSRIDAKVEEYLDQLLSLIHI